MNRYPGIRPYSTAEQHLFFGRDEDIERLYRLVRLEQIVILYGKSGYGKSSLLQAGIFPKLEKEGRYQFWAVRFGPYQAERSFPPTQNVQFNVELKPAGEDWTHTKTDGIWEALKTRQTDENRRFILFFDQFEELFSYPPEQVAAFKQQLAEALYADLPDRFRQSDYADSDAFELKVVFSIRSDRMSQLNALKDYLPNLLQHAYELDALDEQQAAAAVTEPAALQNRAFTVPPFTYAPDTLRATFSALRDDMGRIETSALQIVCRYVENNLVKGEHYIVTPEALGDIKGIFRNFYDATLAELPKEECTAACRLVEDVLIKDGVRLPFAEQALLAEPGVTPALLKKLADTSLLRVERDEQGRMLYEVGHDTLVAPIGDAAAARREAETQERLLREAEAARQREAEALAREQEAERKRRRALWLAVGAGVAAVVAIVSSILAVNATRRAEQSQRMVQEQYQEADRLKMKADSNAQLALERQSQAEKNLRMAKVEEQRANEALNKLQKQKNATEAQRRKAEERAEEARNAREQAEKALALSDQAIEKVVDYILREANDNIYHLNYDLALNKLNSAIILGKKRPEVTNALFEIAYFYGESGRLEEAGELITKASKLMIFARNMPSPNIHIENRKELRQFVYSFSPKLFTKLEARYYPDMVDIPAGEFIMGCDASKDNCNKDELPRHPVRLSSFHIARTETTMWQYSLYCAATGRDIRQNHVDSWGEMRGDDPVIYVSWYDAALYANWLSVLAGLSPAYAFSDTTGKEQDQWQVEPLPAATGYRLPTEAEWEYAARGGEPYPFSGSIDLDAVGWYVQNSNRTNPTTGKKANAFGLYDMSGNASEWCNDGYDENYYDQCAQTGVVVNPPGSGDFAVLRGGSWNFNVSLCRVAGRFASNRDLRDFNVGFRCARGGK